MKLNDYRAYMEKLDTTPQMDARILEYVNEKQQKKLRAGAVRAAVCAIVLLSLATPIKAGTAAVVNYFSELFGEAEEGAAFSPMYSYEDEHVRVLVEQILSDGRNIHLIYSYELLDERGKSWYENCFDDYSRKDVEINPNFKDDNTIKYPVNYGMAYKTAEDAGLAQYETETKKYGMALAYIDTNRWGTNEVRFQFPVPGREIETVIQLEDSVESRVYGIDGQEIEEKGYIPARVTLSAFGILIEGKWRWDTKKPETYSEEEWWQAWRTDSLSLVFADGTTWNLLDFKRVNNSYASGGPGRYTKEQKTDEIDGYIYASYFTEQIDLSDVVGIYIDGNYYALDVQNEM